MKVPEIEAILEGVVMLEGLVVPKDEVIDVIQKSAVTRAQEWLTGRFTRFVQHVNQLC